MISNPGAMPKTDLMEKSVYDTTSKNTDIFSYVDNKVATEASSRSSGDTSTLNSSKSYTDTKFNELNSPYIWRTCDIIPAQGSAKQIQYDSAGVYTYVSGTSRYYYYPVPLQYPINFSLYSYEFYFRTLGYCQRNSSGSSSSGSSRLYFAPNLSYISTTGLVGDKYLDLIPSQSEKSGTQLCSFPRPAIKQTFVKRDNYTIYYRQGWWNDSDGTVSYHTPDAGGVANGSNISKVIYVVNYVALHIESLYQGATSTSNPYITSTYGMQLHYRAIRE